jgi:hypothetical protein
VELAGLDDLLVELAGLDDLLVELAGSNRLGEYMALAKFSNA